MYNVQFIDLNYFYTISGINRNIDGKRVRTWITKAQDINIQSLIGSDLFNKISSEINDETLSGYYLTLNNTYLAPIIVAWAKYYYGLNNVSLTNKGMQEKRSEFSDSPDKEKQNEAQAQLEIDLNSLEVQCLKYIKDNISEFPEYDLDCVVNNPYLRNLGLY